MNRREFLRLSIAVTAGLTIDPEELLWVPNRSRIFVPSGLRTASMAEIVAVEMERIIPKLAMLFERDDTFYRALTKDEVNSISSEYIRIPLSFKGE